MLDFLIGSGYSEEIAAEALKQADNNNEAAMNILMNPELLSMAMQVDTPGGAAAFTPSEEQIMSIVSMGFTPEQANGTLKKTKGNIERAIELLLSGNGVEEAIVSQQPQQQPQPQTEQDGTQDVQMEEPIKPKTEEELRQEEEKIKRQKEDEEMAVAEEELVKDHTNDDEDVLHLAIDLTEEHNLLAQYKALILSSGQQ